MTRRILKILHLLAATGLTGALAAHMLLLANASTGSLVEYAVLRSNIATITSWLLVPSLVVALVTGLFSMAVHYPFQKALWVWLKAAFGLPMFEGTLITIDGTAQQAAALAQRAAAGDADPALVQELVAREWNSLWIILFLAVLQTVLGVWRPRKRRKAAARA